MATDSRSTSGSSLHTGARRERMISSRSNRISRMAAARVGNVFMCVPFLARVEERGDDHGADAAEPAGILAGRFERIGEGREDDPRHLAVRLPDREEVCSLGFAHTHKMGRLTRRVKGRAEDSSEKLFGP